MGPPIYIYLALCLGTVRVRFIVVSRWGPLGRSGVGRLDPGDLLGQRVAPMLSHPAQSGRPGHSDGRSGVTSGLVRLGLHSLPVGLSCAPLSRSPCQLDGAPGEGCLTEAWPGASGHARWSNEMARRGNHHYGGGRQRLLTPPPIVSRDPRERHCPLVRESCCVSPPRKIRRAGVLEPARGLSWPARLSGVRDVLGAHVPGRPAWL